MISIYLTNKKSYIELKNNSNPDQIGGLKNKKSKSKSKSKSKQRAVSRRSNENSNKNSEYISVGKIADKLDPDTVYVLKDVKMDEGYKNAIFKLFPKGNGVNRSLLKINKVGLYSMTKPHDAKIMLDIIEKYVTTNECIMINGTSGIGGEVLNLYTKFKHIYAYEFSKTQFELLKHNVNVYGIKNIDMFNDDFTKHLNDHVSENSNDHNSDGHGTSSSVTIVDPPWGGLDYKKETSLNLKLGEYTMPDLVSTIKAGIILLKLPANHDLYGFNKFKYDTYNVANYLLVVINKNVV